MNETLLKWKVIFYSSNPCHDDDIIISLTSYSSVPQIIHAMCDLRGNSSSGWQHKIEPFKGNCMRASLSLNCFSASSNFLDEFNAAKYSVDASYFSLDY